MYGLTLRVWLVYSTGFLLLFSLTSTTSRRSNFGEQPSHASEIYHFDEGIKQTLIWGYNGTVVIAKVTNAAYNQVFHTSFEDDGAIVDYARTGKRVFSGSFVIPAEQRPISGTYILSYWERINNQWQYKEDEITYTPSDSPLIIASNPIDEVRIHPRDAQMTTYTYDLLVGLTSQTGPNGVTIYQEYDEHNRIKFIRDQDGNIIKNYYYHYKAN